MADILFRPQCDADEDDDEDDESDKWNPACVICLYKQIITYIWSNVDKNRQWYEDPHLHFETHINNIVNKANWILTNARKNLRFHGPCLFQLYI